MTAPEMSFPATPAVADVRGTAPPQLVRAIGTLGLAAGIVNITIGGGIFRLPASVAASLGAAAPLAYLVCAVAIGLIVLCFADAGSRVSLTGGPYAYVEVAFGPFVGFMSGVLLWLLSTFALAAVSTVLASGIGQLAPPLSTWVGKAVVLVLVFASFALVNIRGVRQGATLNGVFTVAKLVPLLMLVVAGAFVVRRDNLVWTEVPAPSTVARTALVLMFAFAGIEGALVPSGEVRDPARSVPRAILLAMLGITVLYLALQVVAQGVLGGRLASAETPLADASGVALGPPGRTLLLVGATLSMLGNVAGMMLAIPRALYAMSRDGFLPRARGAVHPRFRTPHVAIIAQGTITCALAVSSSFERLAIMANVAVLLLYGACCVASWELRRRGVAQGGTPLRVPAPWLVPWLACAVIVWMLLQIRGVEWLAVGICLVLGTAIYATAKRTVTS